MLDLFLEAACEKTKKAEAQEKLEGFLKKLPEGELKKIAYCNSPISTGCGNGSWLEQFKGSPLYEQALALEKQELDIQMREMERRQAQHQITQQFGDWDATALERDQLGVQRRLLELDLASADTGSGMPGGEEEAPVDLEAMEAQPIPQEPKAPAPPAMEEEAPVVEEPKGPPGLPPVAEEQGEEVAPPEEGSKEAPPFPPKKDKEEKSKTEKTTTVTKEKPVEEKEKVDIKTAALQMRFALGLERLKEAAAGQVPLAVSKEAASLQKAKGSIGRGLQLLTGSRASALEARAANRGAQAGLLNRKSDAVMRHAVMNEASDAASFKGMRASHRADVASGRAQRSSASAARMAKDERLAVNSARKDAGKALAGFGAGAAVGAGAMGHRKTAANPLELAATVAAKSPTIRKATEAVQKQVVRNNKPMFSRGTKAIGAGVGAGLAAGGVAALANHRTKEAFGGALLGGLKSGLSAMAPTLRTMGQGARGAGQFAQQAGKSIINAGKAGGVMPAMQAAQNAGRAGMMRAGNFISQNPGAGAAMVAAPAMAAGYAAGRQ